MSCELNVSQSPLISSKRSDKKRSLEEETQLFPRKKMMTEDSKTEHKKRSLDEETQLFPRKKMMTKDSKTEHSTDRIVEKLDSHDSNEEDETDPWEYFSAYGYISGSVHANDTDDSDSGNYDFHQQIIASTKRNIEQDEEDEQQDPWEYFSCHGYILGSVYTPNDTDSDDEDNAIPQQNEAEYDEHIVEKCDPKITIADCNNESIAKEGNLESFVAECDPASAVTECKNVCQERLSEIGTHQASIKRTVEQEKNEEEMPVCKRTKKDPWAYFDSYGYISGSIYSLKEIDECDDEDDELLEENMVADSSQINKEDKKKNTLKKTKRLRDAHGRFIKDPLKTYTAKPLSNKWKEIEKLTESPMLGMKLPFSILYSNDAIWTRTRSKISY